MRTYGGEKYELWQYRPAPDRVDAYRAAGIRFRRSRHKLYVRHMDTAAAREIDGAAEHANRGFYAELCKRGKWASEAERARASAFQFLAHARAENDQARRRYLARRAVLWMRLARAFANLSGFYGLDKHVNQSNT